MLKLPEFEIIKKKKRIKILISTALEPQGIAKLKIYIKSLFYVYYINLKR